jgi:TP901 family phage tail tape measure protein
MATIGNVTIRIGANTKQLEYDLKRAERSLQATATKLQSIGTSLSYGLTLPFLGISAASVKAASDFEAAMSEVKAISGATGEDFKRLEDSAKDLGRRTSKSATEAAEGLKYLALAGFDVEQQLTAIEPVLRLSEAGNIALGRASDLATDSMAALGLQANQLEGFLDIVTNASTKSNTSIEQLTTAFIGVGGAFRNFNTPLEEASALLGILANRGIKGSEAGNGLSTILINLTTGAGQAGNAMQQLGLTAYNADGSFKGVSNVLKELNAKLATMTLEQQNTYKAMIGGKFRITELNALLSGVNEEFDSLNETLKDSEGRLGSVAKTMQDNFKGEVTRLRSAIEGVAIKIGDIFIPLLSKMAIALQKAANFFIEMSDSTLKTIVIIAGIAAAIGPALIAMGAMIKVAGLAKIAMIQLGAGTLFAGGAFKVLTTSIPIIAAISAGVYLIYRNWDLISDTLKGVANFFIDIYNESTKLRAAIQLMVLSWKQVFDTVKLVFELISTAGKLAIDSLVLGFSTVGKLFKAVISGNFKDIPDIIKGAYQKGFDNTGRALYKFGSSFEDYSKSTLENVKGAIDNTFNADPIQRFGDATKKVFEDIKKIPGLGNVLGQTKKETPSAPIGILAPASGKGVVPKIVGDEKEIKTLEQQITAIKDRIKDLSIAYAQKPSDSILKEINRQIDILRGKKKILTDAENLIKSLSEREIITVDKLKLTNKFEDAVNTIIEKTVTKGKDFKEEFLKSFSPKLTITFETAKAFEQLNYLKNEISKIDQQKSDGVISGFVAGSEKIKILTGELGRLRKEGFGSLSPEIKNTRKLLDEIGGFKGFSYLIESLNKITTTLQQVGQVISSIGGLFNAFSQQQIENINAKEQREIEAINNSGLNEEEKQKRIVEAEKRAEKERKAIQRRIAISNKAQALFSATVEMFKSLTKTVGELGPAGLALLPFMKALGLANIAAIAATPLPSLAVGTDYVRSDGLAMLHRGEAVVPADVAGGGFSRSKMELHSVIRGNDIHLINEQNKMREYRMK